MPSLRVAKFWWEISWEPSDNSACSPGLTPALCTGSMFGWGSDLHSVQGEMELFLLASVWVCVCSVCMHGVVFVIAFLVYTCVALDMRPPALMREGGGLDTLPPTLLLNWISLPYLSGVCWCVLNVTCHPQLRRGTNHPAFSLLFTRVHPITSLWPLPSEVKQITLCCS